MKGVFFMIVYSQGDHGRLCVAEMQDFDVANYRLASDRRFEHEVEAVKFGRALAAKSGLAWEWGEFYLRLDEQSNESLRIDDGGMIVDQNGQYIASAMGGPARKIAQAMVDAYNAVHG